MVTFELVDSGARPPQSAERLLELWRRFNALGSRPTRSDFTPFTLKDWLGHIDIYDVEGDGVEFRMRLNGTRVVALTGEDWKGRTAHDIDRKYRGTLHEELRSIYAGAKPLAHHIRIFQKEYVMAYRLVLPIFSEEEDGRVVQIFLVILGAED